jgi:hypothetical protein
VAVRIGSAALKAGVKTTRSASARSASSSTRTTVPLSAGKSTWIATWAGSSGTCKAAVPAAVAREARRTLSWISV